MKLKRNFPCSCGSGKKFKKCCGSKKNDQAGAFFKSGMAYSEQGNTNEAIACFQKALSVNPKYVEVYINLGMIYDKAGLLDKAMSCFQKAVSLDSSNAAVHYNLGVIFYKQQRYEDAAACLLRSLAINSQYPAAYFYLGMVHRYMNNFDDAIACFEKQLSLDSEYLAAHYQLALIYEMRNELDQAKCHLGEGLKCKDTKSACLFLEARLLYREDDLQGALERLDSLEQQGVTPEIYNLYGKVYDRCGEVDNAFDFFMKANRAALNSPTAAGVDPAGYLSHIALLEKKYTCDWVRSWKDISLQQDGSSFPVFLVGFPRSGTTLLDQVLSTHGDIEVLEEWPMLEVMAKKISALDEVSSDAMAHLNKTDILNLQKEYHELARPFLPNDIKGKVIIDKLPLNIVRVGLINRVFPGARFILALRHPFDVCLSNFMQDYQLNDAMANFVTLEETAGMYTQVMDLWRQYTEVLDINYHTVKYEDMVEDLEAEARKLFKFLSVPWDEKVLGYYEHVGKRRSIKTPSYQEISKPIFTRARYRWKRYEKYFEPVKERLMPYVEHFGYDLK